MKPSLRQTCVCRLPICPGRLHAGGVSARGPFRLTTDRLASGAKVVRRSAGAPPVQIDAGAGDAPSRGVRRVRGAPAGQLAAATGLNLGPVGASGPPCVVAPPGTATSHVAAGAHSGATAWIVCTTACQAALSFTGASRLGDGWVPFAAGCCDATFTGAYHDSWSGGLWPMHTQSYAHPAP